MLEKNGSKNTIACDPIQLSGLTDSRARIAGTVSPFFTTHLASRSINSCSSGVGLSLSGVFSLPGTLKTSLIPIFPRFEQLFDVGIDFIFILMITQIQPPKILQ